MISLGDIDGVCVPLEDGIYDAVEMAYGVDLDVIWPLDATGLFQAIKEDGETVGILALYPLSVNGSVTATGNITAGQVSVDDALSNQILYRLDDWNNYSDGANNNTEYWVPAAKIVHPMLGRLDTIEATLQNLTPGSGDGSASWGTVTSEYADLVIGTNPPKHLLLYDSTNKYLREAIFYELFSYNGTTLTILNGRNLVAPGTISAASHISSDGNISAASHISSGGHITATGNITAGGIAASDVVNGVYYRLDDWQNFDPTGHTTDGYVPAAEIVYQWFQHVESEIANIPSGGGGSGSTVTFTPDVDGVYGVLVINNGSPYNLLLYDAQNPYLRKAIWDGVFTVDTTNNLLSLKSPYSFKVLNGSVTASGNITAGGIAASDVINGVYYRLDNWNDYTPAKSDYVPAAGIVYPILDRLDDIEEAIEQGVGSVVDVNILSLPTGLAVVKTSSDGNIGFSFSFSEGYSLLTNTLQQRWDNTSSLFNVIDTEQQQEVQLTVKTGKTSRDYSVTGSIKATGNITAGAQANGDSLGNVLYRLDSWGNYVPAPSAGSTENWVPSAKIVKDELDRLEDLIDAIPSGGGSGANVNILTSWENYDPTDNTAVPSAKIVHDSLAAHDTTLTQYNARLNNLEARLRFVYVLPGESWPPSSMEENVLYIKLNQVS
jgi:hypothetical protein